MGDAEWVLWRGYFGQLHTKVVHGVLRFRAGVWAVLMVLACWVCLCDISHLFFYFCVVSHFRCSDMPKLSQIIYVYSHYVYDKLVQRCDVMHLHPVSTREHLMYSHKVNIHCKAGVTIKIHQCRAKNVYELLEQQAVIPRAGMSIMTVLV